MTRWKPNLAPVDDKSEKEPTDEARLIKIGRPADNFAAQLPAVEPFVVQETSAEPGQGQSKPSQKDTQATPSTTFNPLDDASIDDLGSFLELSSEETPKEAETAKDEAPAKPENTLSRLRPYLKYQILALILIAVSVASYFAYNSHYSGSDVSSTVYILNSNQTVYEEALRLTDTSAMSNFVQRYFISMMLERGLSSETKSRFSSASAVLEWFGKSLKVNRDLSDHAARITFSLSGADPDFMGKLIDEYIGSYIDSKASIDAQTPSIESAPNQAPQSSGSQNTASAVSSQSDAMSAPLMKVDDKLRKLDQTDQEYVSALRLLSKDRFIGSTDTNVFRGFMPESDLATNSALAKLQSRVVELAVQKNALSVKFAPASREIQAIEQEIRGIREAMRQYLNEQRQFVQARRGELLTERAEILRQKALASIESDVISPPQAQIQPVQQKRRASLGNLPSGRFWFVGQDGTTIIAEPTNLGKTIATAAVNRQSGPAASDMAQAISLGQMNNTYAPAHQAAPYNAPFAGAVQANSPGSQLPMNASPMNQVQHPVNNYGVATPTAQSNVQAVSAYKPADHEQQSRNQNSLFASPSLDAKPNGGYQSSQVQQYQNSYYSSPLHTGVSQSPMMSSGLGSKFYQPNAPANRYPAGSSRGIYQ